MAIIDFFEKAGLKNWSKKFSGEIGLEIETETASAKSYPPEVLKMNENTGRWELPSMKFWEAHPDGSLRNFGLEFVLKQPLKYKDEFPMALKEFEVETRNVKFIKDAITTSVHVHLNMLNEKFVTMGNFLTLYTLFENLLIRYSGPDRLSNLFCLPICDAEDTYRSIMHMFSGVPGKNYRTMFLTENTVKYAALNLSAFARYGSLEIRSFRGETDTKVIAKWVGILYSLLEYARKDLTPKDIMLSLKDNQKRLMEEVFGNYRGEIAHPDELQLVDNNVWYAGSIAYGIKDWSSLDETVKVPDFKPKQKELDSAAHYFFAVKWDQLDAGQQHHIIQKLRQDHEKKYFMKDSASTKKQYTTVNRNAFDEAVAGAPIRPILRRAEPPGGFDWRAAGEQLARVGRINDAPVVDGNRIVFDEVADIED